MLSGYGSEADEDRNLSVKPRAVRSGRRGMTFRRPKAKEVLPKRAATLSGSDSLSSHRVGAEDATPVLQGPLVLLAIVLVYLAPVSPHMPGQVAEGIFASFLQQL
jgi:hypothetical protein